MLTTPAMPFQLERLGIVMQPDPDGPREAWGVLNPGGTRGPDGAYYLFPRLVAEGNYSRIGCARVIFDDAAFGTVGPLDRVRQEEQSGGLMGRSSIGPPFCHRVSVRVRLCSGMGVQEPVQPFLQIHPLGHLHIALGVDLAG
jgi:hypothetical protein